MEQRNILQFLTLTSIISVVLISITFGYTYVVNAITGTENSNYFSDDTYIGETPVDGLTKEQATLLLTQHITSWKNANQTEVKFLFERTKLQQDFFFFDIETSVNLARSGQQNPLIVQVDEAKLNEVYDELSFSNHREVIDNSQMIEFLLSHAKSLQPLPSRIYLTEFMKDEISENIVISSATTNLPTDDVSAENWVRKHGEISIEANGLFSLNDIIAADTDGLYTTQFQNELSSLLYKTALNIPMTIVERHVTTDNTYNSEIGYEAYVDVNHDLKMLNEYGMPLSIISTIEDGNFTVSIVGKNTPIQVVSKLKEERTLKPRVIVHSVENLYEEQTIEGVEGKSVTVEREVYIGDQLWKTYDHAVDSYLPKNEVWYRVSEEQTTVEVDSEQ